MSHTPQEHATEGTELLLCVCVCFRHQRGDMKQVPYGGLTNIRLHHKNLVALATCCQGFVHPFHTALKS